MNVLITGASGGIGGALARGFAAAKHRLALHCHKGREKLLALAPKLDTGAFVLSADLSNPLEAQRMVEEAAERIGGLDVLINNAATVRDRTILKMTPEEWREVIDVDLNGAFFCLQAAARIMAVRKTGMILNVSSIAALRGAPGAANYAAAKAGLIALTKTAAKELGRFNVRVNALLPGFHPTAMSRSLWEKKKDEIVAEHALGRLVDPAELARFVVTLCEQQSVSGQVFSFESRVH